MMGSVQAKPMAWAEPLSHFGKCRLGNRFGICRIGLPATTWHPPRSIYHSRFRRSRLLNMNTSGRLEVKYAPVLPVQESERHNESPRTHLTELPEFTLFKQDYLYTRWMKNNREPFPIPGEFSGVPGQQGDLYVYEEHVYYHDGRVWCLATPGFEANGLPTQMYPTDNPGESRDPKGPSGRIFLDWETVKWVGPSKWTPASKSAWLNIYPTLIRFQRSHARRKQKVRWFQNPVKLL
jgi:hypothetical protein